MTKQEEFALKNELSKTKEKLTMAKKSLYDANVQLKIVTDECKSLRKFKENSVDINKYNAIVEENKLLQSDNEYLQRNYVPKSEIDLCKSKRNNELVEKVSKLKEKITQMNREGYHSEILLEQRMQVNRLTNENKRLYKSIDKILKSANYDAFAEMKWTINDAILYLEKHITPRTAYLYNLNNIHEKLKEIANMCIYDDTEKPNNRIRKNVLYGTISDHLNFIGYDGIRYKISKTPYKNIRDYIDYPCKATLTDDKTVSISFIYEEHKQIESHNIAMSKKQEEEKNIKRIRYNKKITVLVVGTKYKEKYTKAIHSYGLQYIWFDSFVQSPSRLFDLYKSCDVAILLKDHMSHNVLDVINVENDNVAIIGNDTERSVMSMVNYLINKNNLASITVS